MTSVVRGWLLRRPRPARVRVTVPGGDVKEFAPQNKSFAKTAETIVALEPDLIELLDARGTLIRAMRGDEDEPSDDDDDDDQPQKIHGALRADPNALMLTHFADLLHRAYKHSTETAFAKMVELVDRMNDRSTSIEERLERAEAKNRQIVDQQVEDAFERAEEVAAAAGAAPGQGGELEQQLAGAFLNPPPNGKGSS